MVLRLILRRCLWGVALVGAGMAWSPSRAAAATCTETVTARVVALDSAIVSNRMGAQLPDGMIFALANDVQPASGTEPDWTKWQPGQVELKNYKRPRPIVLRVDQGQCLELQFRNLTAAAATGSQSPTRQVSIHVQGLNWFQSPCDDGSFVGNNSSSLVLPGQQSGSPCSAASDKFQTYRLFAPEEGPFLLYSAGDFYFNSGGSSQGSAGGDGGQLQQGLFGAVLVEPASAEHYRSQVNHEDLCLATKGHTWNNQTCTAPAGLPQIDYQATYPGDHPSRANLPVLRMEQNGQIVHSDLTAVITGPGAGPFPAAAAGQPGFHQVEVLPDRLQPYREFTIVYHEMFRTQQAFAPLYTASQLNKLIESANDNFAINYGMGGIGSEILANRFGVGPAGGCTDCKYEEFFLSSWPGGDPAMVVNNYADNGCAMDAAKGYTTYKCDAGHQKATKAYFPDDPSNVYHGYLWDHTKFRILHGGSNLHHVHHLHAHQWLRSPNSSSGHYLDSQAIGPGSAFTLEMVYNGGGNKNLTPGDSIFHCHFYPHFAAGMWSLWRVHDVFEAGTLGYPSGQPVANARALPDGEITQGTAIPAIVPLPTRPMAPEPAPVHLVAGGTQVEVCTDTTFSSCANSLQASGGPAGLKNPGYPFFIPGMAGTRAAHPPMDFALACAVSGEPCATNADCPAAGDSCKALDGGLPRHVVETGGTVHVPGLNPLDFSKEVESATGVGLPEAGTVVEQVAMAFHEQRTHSTKTPEEPPGTLTASFTTNGNPRAPGAPYAEPCIKIDGSKPDGLRDIDYWAVDFQTDAVFNKEGWHFPQQRMISLWGDLFDFLGLKGGKPKAPEPFFIRANSNDCVHYHLANLVPKTYELDDFQVRTPTDILGQHIHLVKFDVTSSDGSGNGFNYEDGTLAPDEVVERINAFNNGQWQPTFNAPPSPQPLQPEFIKYFGADPICVAKPDSPMCQCKVVEYGGTKGVKGGRWCGAQATVQRWYVDPTLNDAGQDLTLRTVFTHDHFGPSTHQQAGLYAALVSEPKGSTWHNNEDGTLLGGRTTPPQNGVTLKDGGPTSWQAVIKTADQGDSFREFLLALQDSTLMYQPFSKVALPTGCPAGMACGFCSTKLTQVCVMDPTSPLYYTKVCPPSVSLPNPKKLNNKTQGTFDPSSLERSCNFVPGVPSANSLFFVSTTTGNNPGNIWNGTDLSSLGWDTMPIDPAPNGLFVATKQQAPAQPELITLDGATTNFSVSYRNEPVYSRLYASGNPNNGDPSFVYKSLNRSLPGKVTDPYEPLTAGVGDDDPYTPLLRANAGDNVQIRLVVGAHQNPHNFAVNGLRWLFEPSNVNSGWRATQTMGISEHFELLFRVPGPLTQSGTQGPATTDYLYKPTAARLGQASGNWGLLRAYNSPPQQLFPVPGAQEPAPMSVCPASLMSSDQCDVPNADGLGHMLRCYYVVATTAQDLMGKGVTYNSALGWTAPEALLYVLKDDYDTIKQNPNKAVPGIDPATGLAEPLVLRAAAGDCLKVKLTNKLTSNGLGGGFASNQIPVAKQTANRGLYVNSTTSKSVGLHPQLVSYAAGRSDGYNVGNNATQTAPPGQSVTYWWYAGAVDPDKGYVPVEFGGVNLMPSDPLNHHPYGLFGALVVEPEKATWKTDPNSRASATVTAADLTFREQVLIMQDDGVVKDGAGTRPGGGGFGAFNLRTEPVVQNFNSLTQRLCDAANPYANVACVFSSTAKCGKTFATEAGQCGFSATIPIQTPLFCATKGQQARIRLLHPGGAVTNEVFELFGHTIAEEPFFTRSANCQAPTTHTSVLASQVERVGNECPDGNLTPGPSLTEWKGSRYGHGPANHYEIFIEKAGGEYEVPGDYMYRTFPANRVAPGIWGIFRVTPGAPTPDVCPSFQEPGP